MNKTEKRKTLLFEHLLQNGRISSEDAAQMLQVSASTVRRLFMEIEGEGKAIRVRGALQATGIPSDIYRFTDTKNKFPGQKRQIGLYAASHFVEDGDIIYLDSGTTVMQLSLALKQRIQRSLLKDIQVVTNSIPNMEILNSVANVILIGGRFREERRDFAGYASEQFIRCFNYHKVFLGADGFDPGIGFLGKDTDTARINEVIMARSRAIYILMDSSKFFTSSLVSYARLSSVSAVITDSFLPAESEQICLAHGLKVCKAENAEL
jgi:DeoR/GlpR family transcriptional regulator of sugar metabolism